MKALWKHTIAAVALGWASGAVLAQSVPTGLPAGQNVNAPPAVVPAGPVSATPSPAVTPPPVPPAAPTTTTASVPPAAPSTTQAPPLANAPVVAAIQDNGAIFGTAKCEPPPGCCRAPCCPAPCCVAPNPAACVSNVAPSFFEEEAPQKWHWEIGGGVYYMQPNFHTNPAYLRGSIVGPLNGVSGSTRQNDFRYNMQVAPLAFLSWVHDCGWGVRGRWFQYDQSVGESFVTDGSFDVVAVPIISTGPPLAGGDAGELWSFNSRLRVEAWDLEGTYTFTCCKWNFLVGAGVRYANLLQSYGASRTTPAGITETATSTRNFNGAGPTFSLESRHSLGCGGLAFYGAGRGSILFGTGRLNTTSNIVINDVPGSFDFEARQADILPTLEVEVGLEYGRDVGGVRVFAQTGFVGQVWFNGGNAASSDVGGFTLSTNTNFGFVGLAARLGVNF